MKKTPKKGISKRIRECERCGNFNKPKQEVFRCKYCGHLNGTDGRVEITKGGLDW